MSLIEALSACTSPLITARVFDPLSSVYYRADEIAAAKKATADAPAVQVTLSDTARAKLAA